MGMGDYPVEYDPKKHGPYDPAKYYGKPDTPFGNVLIKDLAPWFARRKMHPSAAMGVLSRAFWRWQHKYAQPRKAGMAATFQVLISGMIFFYCINYGKMTAHRNYKYH